LLHGTGRARANGRAPPSNRGVPFGTTGIPGSRTHLSRGTADSRPGTTRFINNFTSGGASPRAASKPLKHAFNCYKY